MFPRELIFCYVMYLEIVPHLNWTFVITNLTGALVNNKFILPDQRMLCHHEFDVKLLEQQNCYVGAFYIATSIMNVN